MAPAKKAPAKKLPRAQEPTAGKSIEGYVDGLSGWQKQAVERLCALVRAAAPDAVGSIKWAQPVFEDHGPFCYVRAFTQHVNFGFWRGAQLDDPTGRMQSGGEKMAHIKIRGLDDIDEATFRRIVVAAVARNRAEGDPTKSR